MQVPEHAWKWLSLAMFLAVLGLTWNWFDVDEFVNLQQAIRANEGRDLYSETPSNHPPLYIEPILRTLVALPGSDLFAARLANTLLAWGAGLLFTDLYRKAGNPDGARRFLILWSLSGFVLLAGTRAMNEVPVLFFLSLAFWYIQTGKVAALAGPLTAVAGLTRLTTIFYFPALLLADHRRAGRFLLLGAMTGTLGLGVFLILHPGSWDGFLRWALLFHGQRDGEEWIRKIGKAVWWSGLPLLAFLAWRVPSLRERRTPAQIGATVGLLSSLLLVFLPSLHVHYYLPLAPVVTAAATQALLVPNLKRLVLPLTLFVTLTQGVLYIPMTPHSDLAQAERVADWVETTTPTDYPVLTDAPEYAILGGRRNIDGYYWSLKDSVDPQSLTRALSAASVVLVSNRFGHYDRGFPAEFLEELARYPCRMVEDVRVHWTGFSGPPPDEFRIGCATPN